ncbi:MAG: carboxypeptidase-like regulatory domain-containing protein [Chlorobi bacterium]|nr:carboxypeptidase-like regulatory domain-containing protein [Chlorobiota bacterium]
MRAIYITLLNIIIVLSSVNLSAQTGKLILEGRVEDASNNKPVEFANIGIEGTFLGTATDIDGNFNLEINSEFADFNAVISAVGYQAKKLKVSSLSGGNVIVRMTPAVYGLSQVDIKARSKVLYGIIKSASNLIPVNYVSGPVSFSVFYKEEKENNVMTEAVVSLFDNKGYGDRTYTDAFVNRSYTVDEIRRKKDFKPIEDGVVDMDDLLLFDVVRVRGNILDSAVLYDFTLKQEQGTFYEGDSVWVISYKNEKPGFAATGNQKVKSYSGVIYISKTTSAILRNELTIVTDGYFQYGYTGFYNDEIKAKDVTEAEYKIVTSYHKNTKNKYLLSSVSMTKTLLKYDGTEDKYNESMKVLKSVIPDKQFTPGRDYYLFKESNKEFWSRFTLPD